MCCDEAFCRSGRKAVISSRELSVVRCEDLIQRICGTFAFFFIGVGVLGHSHHLLGYGGNIIAIKHRLRRCHLARVSHAGPRSKQVGTTERSQVPALTGAVPPRGHPRDTATSTAPDSATRCAVRPRQTSEGVPGRQVLGQLPGEMRDRSNSSRFMKA